MVVEVQGCVNHIKQTNKLRAFFGEWNKSIAYYMLMPYAHLGASLVEGVIIVVALVACKGAGFGGRTLVPGIRGIPNDRSQSA